MLYVVMGQLPDGRIWECSGPITVSRAIRFASNSNLLAEKMNTLARYTITPVLDV